MLISKTVTYQGKKFKLYITELENKFYNKVYKAELINHESAIEAQNTFVSAKQLHENLTNWIKNIASQASHDSDVLSDLEAWDGVIE